MATAAAPAPAAAPPAAATAQPQFNPDADRGLVFDHGWAGVFFDKLAEYNIVPQSQAEAQELLNLAADLTALEKQSAALSGNRFTQVRQQLHQKLAENGIQVGDAQEAQRQTYEKAAMLARDPAIYGAMLRLKLADAQAEMQAQQAA